MSEHVDLIVKMSLALMVADFMYRALTRSAPLLPRALAIAGALGIVYALAPSAVQTRGGIDEAASIAFCYVSMVLGMIAQYFYAQAERGNKKLELDWMTFLMPIFASPIVFIPLLTLTSEVAMGGAFTRAKLMVYLVAFQNGFFWKSFFEQRRGEAQSMTREAVAVTTNAT
ncbi:MAG TPA: hypothetical protein VIK60_14355 [Vicinamibacterales bacterium]